MTHDDPSPAAAKPGSSAVETIASPGSNSQMGLTGTVAADRLRRDGANDIPEQKSHPLLNLPHRPTHPDFTAHCGNSLKGG